MSNRTYKPKFPQQPYKPKFKPGELVAIAKKICSTPDGYKSTIDPVEFEWKPKQKIVLLHMQFDEPIEAQATWTLAFPIEPFEIGYEKWVEELRKK